MREQEDKTMQLLYIVGQSWERGESYCYREIKALK